jgi:phosphoglycerate kinase
MAITWLDEIDPSELANKRVLCRVDFNVPMDEQGTILDAQRIELALPTIRRLIRADAKVIILSHLGRPKGKPKTSLSLEPVAAYLRDLIDQEVIFVHDCVGDGVARIVNDAKPGNVIFLENVRFHGGEEKNDTVFAKLLAKNSDLYVNDAFGAIHRAHASVDGVAKFFEKPLGGLLLKKELLAFEKIIKNPKRPLVALLGGAKVSSKIGVLLQLMKKVDAFLIGGAMAYTFLVARGETVGKSLVEKDKISLAENLLRKAKELNVKVYLPKDHVVAKDIESKAGIKTIFMNEFSSDEIGLDIGPETVLEYKNVIKDAKTIFWNGPMGIYEHEEFSNGTNALMKAVADSDAYSVVGGGDSIAALNKAGLLKEIDFISSGGGAGLELLEGKILPGLLALGYYDS